MTGLRARLAAQLREIPGVVESESAFAQGSAFWVNGKEIAHFEDEDRIDVRLTKGVIRERRPALKTDERVTLRPSGADWLSVRCRSREDLGFVVELVRAAELAHRPAEGMAAKPPPQGRELERRRRFH